MAAANAKLETYLDDLLEHEVFATRGKIAEAIGMTDSGFSRAVKEEGTLSITHCIRLAHILRETPSRLLRVAGHGDLAAVLDDLYRGKGFQLTRREREVVQAWRAVTEVERRAMESMLRVAASRSRSALRARITGPARSGGGKVNRRRRFRT